MSVVLPLSEPQDAPDSASGQVSRFVSRLMAAAVLGLGTLVLLGWWLDWPAARTVLPGLTSMKFNAALSFVLAGLGLRAFAAEQGRPARLARGLGALVGLLALATLAQDLFGWNLGIDDLLFDFHRIAGESSGRMSPATAVCFALCGSSLAAGPGWITEQRCQCGAWAACCVALGAFFGYLFDVESLYRLGGFSSVAVHTAVGLLLLAVGILLARPQRRSLARWARLSIVAALAAQLGVGWVVAERLRELSRAEAWETHAHEVLRTLEQAHAALFEAESAQRGFVVTGDAGHLERYAAASQRFWQRLAEVGRLTADNPRQEQRLAALRPVLQAKFDGMAQNVRLRRSEGFEAAQASVRAIWERGYMAAIGRHFALLEATEEGLLNERRAAKERVGRRTVQTLTVGGIFVVLTVLGVFLLLWREVAERRRSERDLRQNKQQLTNLVGEQRAILDSAVVGYVKVRERHYVWANDALAEALGYPMEELMGQSVRVVYFDDADFQAFGAAAYPVLQAGGIYRGEMRCRRKDGSACWFAVSGSLLRPEVGESIWAFVDISGRKEAETALERARQRFETFVLRSPVAIAVIQEGRLSLRNAQFDRLFGYAGEELQDVDEWWLKACPDADYRASVRHAWARAVEEGGAEKRATAPVEYQVRCRDGTVRHVEMSGVALEEVFLATFVDVTELKHAQLDLEARNEALRLRTEEAETASRAKSEFLAAMSHEIRTPMNAILGTALVLERSALEQDQRHLVGTIRTAGRSLMAVINDVLDFSKIEAGHFELEETPFVLRNVMSQHIDVQGASADNKGLALALLPLPEKVDALVGDAQRLTQVLNNLTGNAIKFTARGGVTLSVAVVRQDEERLWLRFGVRDSGIGIAPDKLAGLFDAFVQAESSTRREYGGSGLGLAICRQLVTLMGGEIGVDSQPGVGSEFWFVLPFVASRSMPVAAPASVGSARLHGLRILVVDDSEVNLDIARRLLEMEGAQVELAAHGLAAVERLRRAPEAFDLVLMDIQMPVLDGIEATCMIRKDLALAGLPILALTAGALPSQRERAFGAGMNDFVTKPFELDAMVAAILRRAGHKVTPSAVGLVPGVAPIVYRDFPVLPGINHRRATQRYLGDRALFMHALHSLGDEFAGVLPALRADLAEGRWEEGSGRVHKLRGVAGNLAAERLAESAGQLESALRSGRTDGIEVILGELASALAEVLSGMPVEPEAPPAAGGEADPEISPADIEGLLRALAERDISALDRCAALRPALLARYGAAAVAELVAALDNLRFGEAQRWLRSRFAGGERSRP